jgi:hypothetical protein
METAHQYILHYLTEWLTNHPAPDQPALSVANLGEYSPRELCDAVEKQTEAGRFLESLILFGAKCQEGDLRAVLESFTRENAPDSGINRLMIEQPR